MEEQEKSARDKKSKTGYTFCQDAEDDLFSLRPGTVSLHRNFLLVGSRRCECSQRPQSCPSMGWREGWVSDVVAPNKASVWWFQLEIKPSECPWAFVEGSSARRIAALEMLGALVLVALIFLQSNSTFQLSPMSGNQGNVFAFLNQPARPS